jgi:hypothetical protein
VLIWTCVTDVVTGVPVSDLGHGTLYGIYCVDYMIGAELTCRVFVFTFALVHSYNIESN